MAPSPSATMAQTTAAIFHATDPGECLLGRDGTGRSAGFGQIHCNSRRSRRRLPAVVGIFREARP